MPQRNENTELHVPVAYSNQVAYLLGSVTNEMSPTGRTCRLVCLSQHVPATTVRGKD